MEVPRFWTIVTGETKAPDGRRVFRSAWGWSVSSFAEAVSVAQQRLRTALANPTLPRGPGGYYPRMPPREPILDELVLDGATLAVVTRNRYGAEILNTDRVLIADVDLPGPPPSLGPPTPRPGLLRRLFLPGPPPPPVPAGPSPELDATVQRIAHWAGQHPGLGVLVYRTAAGLRVFVTGLAEPTREEQLLVELDADPLYRELCRAHGTFRARLTPKPWRLPGIKASIDRWPFAGRFLERRFERWLAGYQEAARDYAVCALLATHGPAPSHVEAAVISLHDKRTGVATGAPLA